MLGFVAAVDKECSIPCHGEGLLGISLLEPTTATIPGVQARTGVLVGVVVEEYSATGDIFKTAFDSMSAQYASRAYRWGSGGEVYRRCCSFSVRYLMMNVVGHSARRLTQRADSVFE